MMPNKFKLLKSKAEWKNANRWAN